jgi:hypothetical protein
LPIVESRNPIGFQQWGMEETHLEREYE